jgi:hypothetical protein
MYVWIISFFIAVMYLIISKKLYIAANRIELIYRLLCIESFVFLIASYITNNDLYIKVLYAILFLEIFLLLVKKIKRNIKITD